MIEELKRCRVCNNTEFKTALDLGRIYPSGFLKDGEELPEESKAPLVLCKCQSCGLVQLKHTIELDSMYRQYWYSSSLNKSMVSSLQNIIDDVESKIDLMDEDMVIDIGANDCTMLGLYKNRNLHTVGFEPALNIRPVSGKVITWIPDYFSIEAFETYFTTPTHPEWLERKAKVITAIAMFYDLPDPIKFTKDVATLLDDDGVFVVQFTDLLSMFKASAFDNICHEHLEYYRLYDVVSILAEAGLRVCDVSYNDVNGASVRVTAVHRDSVIPTNENVVEALMDEYQYFDKHDFEYFSNKVKTCIEKVTQFLAWCKSHNHSIHLLGASTKGNTLLQVCGITDKDIPFAAEVNKDKLGLRTAGSNINIISEEESLIMHPTHYLVPVWHFKDSIVANKNIQNYLKSNGALVFPLPYFTIIKEDGEFKL